MKSFFTFFFILVMGFCLGAIAFNWSQLSSQLMSHDDHQNHSVSRDDEPLYWVAPMDSSYRRDKPGKSPMGMDLVPVYAKDNATKSQDNSVWITPQVQHNMGVKTQPVQVRRLNPKIETVGRVTFNENALTHMHPRVEGWVENLYIKAKGESVKKGQPVYTLYSPKLVSVQEEFLVALASGNESLIQAGRNRLANYHLAPSFIESLEKSKTVSQSVTFYAPKSGVVEHLNIREGFFVKPGTAVISIAPIESVWVMIDVFEKDIAKVALGQPITVTFDGAPNRQWRGDIDFIYPELNPTSRTLSLRANIDNPQAVLKPDMYVDVSIQTQTEALPVIAVPISALIRTQNQNRVVLRQGEGKFKSVEVKVGQRDNTHVEIREGLLPGDQVVVSAQFLIDSESSKNADFTRMSAPQHQASVTGKVVALHFPEHPEDSAKITIAREAIEKWQRPAATMQFTVSPHIDLGQFHPGDDVAFTFVAADEFRILALRKIAMQHSMKKEMQHSMKEGMHHD